MKKIVSLLLVLLLALTSAVAVNAEGVKDVFGVVTPKGATQSFTSGATTVTVDTSAHTITVSGNGAMADYHGQSGTPWDINALGMSYAQYNKETYSLVVESGVTHIGSDAFAGQFSPELSSVQLADTVTSVGIGAFSANHNLASVRWSAACTTIDKGVFSGCLSLANLTNISNVTTIDQCAFLGSGISGRIFSDFTSLATINAGAFAYTDCLGDVVLPASVRTIGEGAFGPELRSMRFNDGLQTIGARVFGGASMDANTYNAESEDTAGSLSGQRDITIPSTVTSIGNKALNGFDNIYFGDNTAVTFATNPTVSGSAVTNGSITTANRSNNNTTHAYIYSGSNNTTIHTYAASTQGHVVVDDGVLRYESGDTYVYIYPSTHAIVVTKKTANGDGAMADYLGANNTPWYYDELYTRGVFSNLSEYQTTGFTLTVEPGVTHIGSQAFAGQFSPELTSIELPDTVTSVGAGAFDGKHLLTNVRWSSNCTTIPNGAFTSCERLASVTNIANVTTVGQCAFFGDVAFVDSAFAGFTGVTDIQAGAFSGAGLENVVLPSGVTTIGDGAFGPGLSTFEFNEGLTTIGENIFGGASNVSASYTATVDTSAGYLGAQTDITIPSTVTSIGNKALNGFDNIYFGNNTNVTLVSTNNTATTGSITVKRPANLTTVYVNADSGTALHTYCAASGGHVVIGGVQVFESGDTYVSIYESTHRIVVSKKPGNGNGAMADYHRDSNYGSNTPWNIGDLGMSTADYNANPYSLVVESGVTHIGVDAFAGNMSPKLSSVQLPDTVTSVGEGAFSANDTLTTVRWSSNCPVIDDAVFHMDTGLTTISNVANVTTVGVGAFAHTGIKDSAFSGFTALTTISTGAFSDSGLKDVVLPSSVRTIGDGAFGPELRKFTFNEGLTTIGNNIFGGANIYDASGEHYTADQADLLPGTLSGQTDIAIPGTVTSIGNKALNDFETIDFGSNTTVQLVDPSLGRGDVVSGSITAKKAAPTTVYINPTTGTTLNAYVAHTQGVEECVIISDSVVASGDCSYKQDGSIMWSVNRATKTLSFTYDSSLDTGSGILKAYNKGLYNGDGITCDTSLLDAPWIGYADIIEKVEVGEGIRGIAEDNNKAYEFAGLNNLVSISLPSTIDLSSGIFAAFCPNLEEITLPQGNSRGLYIDASGVLCDSTLESVVLRCPEKYNGSYKIADDVHFVRSCAFHGCTSLTSVTFGSGIVSANNLSFANCTGLISVTLNEGLTGIGTNVFANCTGLKEANFPSTLEYIDTRAFYKCSGLTSLTLPESVSQVCNSINDRGALEESGVTQIVVLNKTSGAHFNGLFTKLSGFDADFCNNLVVYGYAKTDGNEDTAIKTAVETFNTQNGTHIQFNPLDDTTRNVVFVSEPTGAAATFYSAEETNEPIYTLTTGNTPERDGYVFAGWFNSSAAAASLDTTGAYGTNVILAANTVASYTCPANSQTYSNAVVFYAGWVKIDTLTVDPSDDTNYTGATFKGFSLEGVQLREDNEAMRFVTVIGEKMLTSIRNLNGAVCEYGYVLYGRSTVIDSLTLETAGAVDVKGSANDAKQYRMFTNYRMCTCVITYETEQDKAYINSNVEARAYIKYIDANGLSQIMYNTYLNKNGVNQNAGGCKTSLHAVQQLAGRV